MRFQHSIAFLAVLVALNCGRHACGAEQGARVGEVEPGWLEFRSSALGLSFQYPANFPKDDLVLCGNARRAQLHAVLDSWETGDPPRELLSRWCRPARDHQDLVPKHRFTQLEVLYHADVQTLDERALSWRGCEAVERRTAESESGDRIVCWWIGEVDVLPQMYATIHHGEQLILMRMLTKDVRDLDVAMEMARRVRFFEPEAGPTIDSDGRKIVETAELKLKVPGEWLLNRSPSDSQRDPASVYFYESPMEHAWFSSGGRGDRGYIARADRKGLTPIQQVSVWEREFAVFQRTATSRQVSQRIVRFDVDSGAKAYRLVRKWRNKDYLEEVVKALLNGDPLPRTQIEHEYVIGSDSSAVVFDCVLIAKDHNAARRVFDRVARTIQAAEFTASAPTHPDERPAPPERAPAPR